MLERAYAVGYRRAFEKLALDLKGARSAVSAMAAPFRVRRNVHMNMGASSPSTSVSIGQFAHGKGLDKGPSAVGRLPTHPEILPHLPPRIADPGTIFAQGDMHQLLDKRMPALTRAEGWNPANREMLNRTTLMHEGLERQAILKDPNFASWNTHANPGVILRENNMVASLGSEFNPVKGVYRAMRRYDQTAPALEGAIPGFQYGKQRYSRHAIKHMEEIAARKGVVPLREADLVERVRGHQAQQAAASLPTPTPIATQAPSSTSIFDRLRSKVPSQAQRAPAFFRKQAG